MDFDLAEEHRMLQELVARFVCDELMPLEAAVLARDASGDGVVLMPAEKAPIDARSRELGLWGLDAPADVGGADLPAVAMMGVNIELGKTVTPYVLPPDSPNLRMLMATANEDQRGRRSSRDDDSRRPRWRGLGDKRPQDLDQPRRRS